LRGEGRIERLEFVPGQNATEPAEQLRVLPEVELVEPNYLISREQVTPNDARYGEQWALGNVGQTGGTVGSDINAQTAWQATTGGTSTVIAVVDSGVDFSHPDLSGNRWANTRERDNNRDDDHNGYVNDYYGWDWVADSNIMRDDNGHGTAVAGIIAAQGNNGVGTSGVMWRAGLMSLRVLDAAGGGNIADAVEAIEYAAAAGAKVINCSWGTEAESHVLRDAIERAGRRGVVVVTSAGNGSRDLEQAPYYPASFDLPNLIAVASTDQFDNLAPFSNWGGTHVAVGAPGIDLLTTMRGGGYVLVSGTSFSAPLVSGAAGLVATARPWLNAQNIKRAILDGGRSVFVLQGRVASAGVVSAAGTLSVTSGTAGGGNGEHQEPPRPHNGNRGDGVRRADPRPPTPHQVNGPNLDAVKNQASHVPQPPPAGIGANAPPICGDCFEAPGSDPEFSTSRSMLANETGQPEVDLGSKNFNWALPLVNLPGRAGHDLNLTLYYNSLVWVRQGNAMQYNPDTGNPSPGFKLGFPSIQKQFIDGETSNWAVMLITPAGGRVKMRWKTSSTFEATDGSYMQLTMYSGGAVLRTKDGTQYTFDNTANGEKRCREIKDRNGNYITIGYDGLGRVQSATDTLGRVINFIYNGNGMLYQLTQSRGTSGHTDLLAQFDYGDQWISGPYFVDAQGNLLTMYYPEDAFAVLTQVWIPDGVTHQFSYSGLGQVYKIRRLAPNGTELSHSWYNLPHTPDVPNVALHDAPRFTERRDWIKYGVLQQDQTVSTIYGAASDGSMTQVTPPDPTPTDPTDNVVYKEFFATTGWQTGLTTGTEVWVGGVKKKWTSVAWTQDNTSSSYQENPRPIETNVYDEAGNRRRTTIDYTEGYSLPTHVREWAGPNGDEFLRLTATSFQLAAPYLDKRLIGLPYQRIIYDGPTGAIVSKVIFQYDLGNEFRQFHGDATQHDPAYNTSFEWRGNVWSVARFDANYPNDWNRVTETRTGYNTNGSPIFTYDAEGHQTTIGYADSYSDGNNSRGTYAYPTTIVDPELYNSTIKYNYATGAVMETKRPSSGTNSQGNVTYETQTMAYDWSARLQRVTNLNNDLYTRWEYPDDMSHLRSYSNLKPGHPEAYSVEVYDGAGRARRTASYMPEKTDRYSSTMIHYNALGQVVKQSKATETLGDFTPTGPDDSAWVYTEQEYDWQGRPTRTIRPDLYTVEVSYGGCGCAGGEVVTVKDEAGRRRKLYKDSLGRLTKVEELSWNQSVYSTTTYSYNSRDQLTLINQQGLTRTMEYDGYGRLWKRTTPEQGMTEYSYERDDTVAWVKDARGAKTVFDHSPRHLVREISFDLSGVIGGQNVASTPTITYAYDAAGSRTQMTDGLGSVAYTYDSLSRPRQESRTITSVGTFNFTYDWDNAGLSSVTNHWGSQVSYNKDHTGSVTSVTGAGPISAATYASGLQYRAFGAVKAMTYGNSKQLSITYDSRMRPMQWNVSGVTGSEYRYDYFHEHTGRVTFARNLYDATLDRSFEYDHVGRLTWAYTGTEATAHAINGQWGQGGGPYAQAYDYDVWGNITQRLGWGGWNASASYTYTNNLRSGSSYDLAGNITFDGSTLTYDATGQQTSAVYTGWNISNSYDGDRLRVRKEENGETTYYLRSSVLGGQVAAEVRYFTDHWDWAKGYVYLGGQLMAVQESGAVSWVHEDPITKSKKTTDASGAVTSSTVTDPWGGEVTGSWVFNTSQQKRKYTSYDRNANGRDEAMHRSYHAWFNRFDQPDPSDGSYDLADPQSFNRFAYVQNDPVNFIDPSGLNLEEPWDPGEVVRGYTWAPRWEMNLMYWRFLFWSPGIGGDIGTEGGGGGGGEPQDPRRMKEVSDCEVFAALVASIASRVLQGDSHSPAPSETTLGRFEEALRERFAKEGYDIASSEFGSSGFKSEFQDPDPNNLNQVRHYVGAFRAALLGGPLGRGIMNYRERPRSTDSALTARSHQADKALNRVAFRHANDISDIRDLPGMIRKDVCE
jgi:RHS repeat-associated protein